MNEIHETCVIHPSAIIGDGNYFGPFCVIGPKSEIGNDNHFVAHVCIGTPGQFRGKMSLGGVRVGNRNKFHEFSQVHQAMDRGDFTLVGDDGYFMKGAHIAHDCVIEDGVTMCNDATLGGHTTVMTKATLGFLAVVHQGQVIGSFSMLGMGAIVPMKVDIEPGRKYAGNPARFIGENDLGLSRNSVNAFELQSEIARYAAMRDAK